MPFNKINIKGEIQKRRDADSEFKTEWDNSRMEYDLLSELIRLRKERGLSQVELAKKTKSNQRVISRIEKQEQSPTLKTLCNWANALEVDIKVIPR